MLIHLMAESTRVFWVLKHLFHTSDDDVDFRSIFSAKTSNK